jgi:hypothetical protein
MLGRMPVRRVIATADMTAGSADTQVNPGRTGLQTFLAASRTRCDVADRIKMRAGLLHRLSHRCRGLALAAMQRNSSASVCCRPPAFSVGNACDASPTSPFKGSALGFWTDCSAKQADRREKVATGSVVAIAVAQASRIIITIGR